MFSAVVPGKPRKQPAGGGVDHGDQIQLLSPPLRKSCALASHCTSSPKRLRRGRHTCTVATFCSLARHSLPRIIHCRTVSLPPQCRVSCPNIPRQRRPEPSVGCTVRCVFGGCGSERCALVASA